MSPANIQLLSDVIGVHYGAIIAGRYAELHELADAPVEEIAAIPRIGKSVAKRVKAALSLGSNAITDLRPAMPKLEKPEIVAPLMRPYFASATTEVLFVITLTPRRTLINVNRVADGTLDCVHIHAREVFRLAILQNASAIVLAHNHPSGDASPSTADISVTRELIRAGRLLKIDVLDHLILGHATPEREKYWYSLRELGFFEV
jgi:DNA repair protein RadC